MIHFISKSNYFHILSNNWKDMKSNIIRQYCLDELIETSTSFR